MGVGQIPQVIHLCWFSGDDYPEKIRTCVDSWRRVVPDFEIRVWDMDAVKDIDIPFLHEALAARKWAFAADVVRLYALYHFGGVYMDSDILLKRRFDEYLQYDAVFFQEYHPNDAGKNPEGLLDGNGRLNVPGASVCGIGIQAALMMAAPGQPVIRRLLDIYTCRAFLLPDGTYNIYPIAPSLYATALAECGYRYADEEQQVEGARVFPSRFVAGHRSQDNRHAFAIHLVAHSWKERNVLKRLWNLFRRDQ